jgi:hypothetical protein
VNYDGVFNYRRKAENAHSSVFVYFWVDLLCTQYLMYNASENCRLGTVQANAILNQAPNISVIEAKV